MPELLLQILFYLLWIVAGVVCLWATVALFCFPLGRPYLGLALAGMFAACLIAVCWLLGGSWTALAVWGGAAAVVVAGWMFYLPSHRLACTSDEPPMPRVKLEGDTAIISHFRETAFDDDGEPYENEVERRFDLSQLESAWLGMQPFPGVQFLGHTFVSFGFADGEYLAISVQSLRPRNETFNPLIGMFKRYGLTYYIGDERQTIGHGTLSDGHPLYLYRIRSTSELRRAMLEQMLNRANELADKPEFYHSLVHNCTTNIICDLNRVAKTRIVPYAPRILLSGLTGHVAYDHGLIECGQETFEEIRRKADVAERGKAAFKSPKLSAELRIELKALAQAEAELDQEAKS